MRKVFAWERVIVFWSILILIAAAVLLSIYRLFRWASADPAIDDEIAKERFRAEQDWRALHRSGAAATTTSSEHPQNVP